MDVRWVTALLDRPAATWDDAVAFWSAATGSTRSAPRGEWNRFATLLPPTGDPHLRTQRIGHGPGGVHLDLHVDDPDAAADEAVGRGARVVGRPGGHVVLRSPGGLGVCTVPHQGEATRCPPVPSPTAASRSLVDQVCLDVPRAAFDAEVAFWSAVTGWPAHTSSIRHEFAVLERPAGQPVRLLVQRLDDAEPDQLVAAHLDVACEDRAATVDHHRALGASVVATFEHWTVLADPSGAAYCCTDRHPDTGVIAPG